MERSNHLVFDKNELIKCISPNPSKNNRLTFKVNDILGIELIPGEPTRKVDQSDSFLPTTELAYKT